MAKVKYDPTPINDVCIQNAPQISQKLQELSSQAAGISFPEGDFGWSSITGLLNDASEETNSYTEWLKTIYESKKVVDQHAEVELEEVKTEDINPRGSIVK